MAAAPRSAWRGALAGLVVGVVAFSGSWYPSLWSDESATISAAQRSLPELWTMVGNIDLVHGLYYFGMHLWVKLFGISELAVRAPSAIAVGVAGACVYWIGLRLGGPRLALWSIVIFALLPRAFFAGTEARPYAFTAMLASAATLALLVALDTRSSVAWASYAGLLLLGILGNLYLGLLVVAHLVGLLTDRTVERRQRISWAKAVAAALVVALPFLVAASQQTGQLGDHEFGWRDLAQNVAVNQWFLGDTPTTTTGVVTTSVRAGDVGTWWAPAGLLFAGVAWLLIAYAVFRVARGADGDPAGDGRQPLAWLLPWLVVPTVVIGVYSVVSKPMYSARYLTFAAPAAALLIALGLVLMRSPWWRRGAAVVIVLAAIPIFISQRQLHAKNSSDWATAAEQIEQGAEPGDGVYFAPRYDVGGGTVGRTTRGMQTAYPDSFAGLIDITLVESPESTGDLTGRSRRLRDSGDALDEIDTLWVVRRIDYPERSAAADDAFLTDRRVRAGRGVGGPARRCAQVRAVTVTGSGRGRRGGTARSGSTA